MPIKNVRSITITGIRIVPTNLQAERNILVSLDVDGASFELKLQFEDETLTDRTFTGKRKQRAEQN